MALLIQRYAPDGARSAQEFDGSITVGRATDNQIELPGLLVALHHLRLTEAADLSLQVDSLSPIGVTVNGVPGQSQARLVPGDELGLGPHRLCLGLTEDKTALLLEVFEKDTQAAARTGGRVGLAEAGWRMRRPAVMAFALILWVCVLLPLLLRAFPLPATVARWLPGEQLWLPGAVSHAHSHFSEHCASCHEGLFARVKDSSCLSCHAGIKHHGDDAKALAGAGLDARRCASCHLEHGGPHAAMPSHPATCTGCHARPDRFPALAGVGAAPTFSRHPAFRITITEASAQGPVTVRKLLTPEIKDRSGLVFTHDRHFEIRDPKGPSASGVLQCGSCHRPATGGISFEPVKFAASCQRCHQLDAGLPHGDNEAARRYGLTRPPEPVVEEPQEERRRPGANAERATQTADSSPADGVFRQCAKCHDLNRAEGQPLGVIPPRVRESWLPMARFSHAPHQWVGCANCHAAQKSSNPDDLMLPQVQTCQGCHSDEQSSSRIPTTCIDCHRFHQARTMTMDAPKAMEPTKGAPAHAPPPG